MTDEGNANSEDAYTRLIPIIVTVLRILGIYMTISGVGSLAEHLARMLESNATSAQIAYFRPQLFGDVVYVAGSLYLIFGGRWLIDNVFLPSKREAEDEDAGDG